MLDIQDDVQGFFRLLSSLH